jgi:hypothetical protein
VLFDKINLGLEDCGAGGEGFTKLLVVLARTIDHWRKCWDTMMDKIDEIISVEVRRLFEVHKFCEVSEMTLIMKAT